MHFYVGQPREENLLAKPRLKPADEALLTFAKTEHWRARGLEPKFAMFAPAFCIESLAYADANSILLFTFADLHQDLSNRVQNKWVHRNKVKMDRQKAELARLFGAIANASKKQKKSSLTNNAIEDRIEE